MDYQDVLSKVKQGLVGDVEAKIGRPMTDAEKLGLENQSLMMLESISMGFYMAESDEIREEWLREVAKLGENHDRPHT